MRINTIDNYIKNKLPKLRIAVVGDIMVDRYVSGEINRISPEAPVPVNRVTEIREVLGGAANVAANLSNLDCNVFLAGVAGNDDHGNLLIQLLENQHIDDSGILYESTRRTTTKVRILGEQQQMIRLDFEENIPINEEECYKIVKWLERLADDGLDGIVVSDYGKGVCGQGLLKKIINIANKYNIITIIDPKGSDWYKYEGATFITPNVKELSEYVGYSVPNTKEDVVKAAREVLKDISFDYIVVTRSAEGITVVTENGNVWHNPAVKQEVFDVSGAGDTVVAIMITAVSSGLSIRAALHLANSAAGVVVSKVGTYPIHRSELINLWEKICCERTSMRACYTVQQLVTQIRIWQSSGETVVFTNGCFDILHGGHIAYLRKAAALGDRLIIGVYSDTLVKRFKGDERPTNKEFDRVEILSSLKMVDGVVTLDDDILAEILSILRPNILVKRRDYKPEDVIGGNFGGQVVVLPFRD